MDNPFLKRLMKKDAKEDIFHSSSYGRAQSDDKVGAASVESFRQRQMIAKNRKMVRGYSDSQLGNFGVKNGQGAKVYTPPEKTMATGGAVNGKTSGLSGNQSNIKK